MELTPENFGDKGKKKYAFITDEKIAKIDASKQSREKILKKYGGSIPESIIKADFSRRQLDPFIARDGIGAIMGATPEIGFSDKGSKKSISRFPWNVGEIFLHMYTQKGDWVFDPFSGHNSRLQICYENGRHYHGFDLCHEYMEHNRAIRDLLLRQDLIGVSKPEIRLTEGDSRKIDLPAESFDFCITSPPYWRQEHYGDEAGQLEKCKTYEQFLMELQPVVNVTAKVLKHGAYCVWCVNDFRDKTTHQFSIFHADLIAMFQRAGLTMFDLAIIDLGRSIRACFANQFEQEKYLPKRHEYAVIAIKP